MGRLPTICHAPPINMKLGLSKVQTTDSKLPGYRSKNLANQQQVPLARLHIHPVQDFTFPFEVEMVISLRCVSIQELHIMILSMFAPQQWYIAFYCSLLLCIPPVSTICAPLIFILHLSNLCFVLCFCSVHFALPSSNFYIPLIYALHTFNFALP